MKRARSSLAFLLGTVVPSIVAVGCLPEFDDDVSQVEGFRVLAIRAEPAEVEPGEAVTLSVLWAVPDGETVQEDQLSWGFCTQRKELTEPGPVSPGCIAEFGDPDSEIIGYLGSGASAEGAIARDVCRYFGPLAPPPEPGTTTAGRPVDPDVTGGFYQPVLVGEDEPTLGAVRLACGTPWLSQSELVNFNQGYRPNEHPEFSGIWRESEDSSEEVDPEVPIEVEVGGALQLEVRWEACPEEPECGDGLCTAGENGTSCADDCRTDPVGCTGGESYLLADVETRAVLMVREKVSVAWFTTGGTFATSTTDDPAGDDRTENVWTAPGEAGAFSLWLVLRDDRGGVSWRELQVEVQDP
jgi:hypothetical protein